MHELRLPGLALLFTIATWMFAPVNASTAQASPIIFSGEDGPASAELAINQDREGRFYPRLLITYKGYLYGCTSWNYGRTGETVQSVLIIPKAEGDRFVQYQAMRSECYYHGVGEDRALLSIDSLHREVWNSLGLPTHGTLPHAFEIELAFEKRGQWDSEYGRNYRIKLERQ